MENYKTIKELADELNISKQAVRKYFDKMPTDLMPKIVDGRYVLSKDATHYIRDRVAKVDTRVNQVDSTKGQSVDREVDTKLTFDLTEKLLLEKDSRILFLENQNENLNKLLDQQQQLTLQSNKQIEKLQNQLALLAPKMENDEEDRANEEPIAKEITPMKEQPKKEPPFKFDSVGTRKKWWQLWK